MLQILKVLKAWLEITDNPPLVVPALAIRNSVIVNPSGTVSMYFKATTAELNAVVMGKRYEVQTSRSAIAMLELTPMTAEATAKDSYNKSGYIIEAQDPATTTALAFLPPPPNSDRGTSLEIVQYDKVQASNQIAIANGGKCRVSSNLIGSTIKIRMPVIYPEVVLVSQEPINNITAHLVVEWADSSIKYVGLLGSLEQSSNANLQSRERQITLRFDLGEVKVEALVD